MTTSREFTVIASPHTSHNDELIDILDS